MLILDSSTRQQITTIAFDHTGTRVVGAGGAEHILIWETTTGRCQRVVVGRHAANHSIAVHPNAPWLFVATHNALTAYNPETDEKRLLKLEQFTWANNEYVGCVAVDSTGTRLLSYRAERGGSASRILVANDISDAEHPKVVWDQRVNDRGEFGWSRGLAFYPDGERFVSVDTSYLPGVSGWRHRLVIRKADTGKPLHELTGPGVECEDVAVSPRADCLVTRHGMVLYVFDGMALEPAATAPKPRRVLNDNRRHFTGIAFHPSGRYLAATSNDKTVKLYDTATWEVARTFTWEIGKMRSIAFTSDGTLAAAGSDTGKVVVWDVDV